MRFAKVKVVLALASLSLAPLTLAANATPPAAESRPATASHEKHEMRGAMPSKATAAEHPCGQMRNGAGYGSQAASQPESTWPDRSMDAGG